MRIWPQYWFFFEVNGFLSFQTKSQVSNIILTDFRLFGGAILFHTKQEGDRNCTDRVELTKAILFKKKKKKKLKNIVEVTKKLFISRQVASTIKICKNFCCLTLMSLIVLVIWFRTWNFLLGEKFDELLPFILVFPFCS